MGGQKFSSYSPISFSTLEIWSSDRMTPTAGNVDISLCKFPHVKYVLCLLYVLYIGFTVQFSNEGSTACQSCPPGQVCGGSGAPTSCAVSGRISFIMSFIYRTRRNKCLIN